MQEFATIIEGHAHLLRFMEMTAILDNGQDDQHALKVRSGLHHLLKCSYDKIDAASPANASEAADKIRLLSAEQARHFMGFDENRRAVDKALQQACVLSLN